MADFIGESNILSGVMLEDYKVEFADTVFECVDKGFKKNEPIDVIIRPEDLKIRDKDDKRPSSPRRSYLPYSKATTIR